MVESTPETPVRYILNTPRWKVIEVKGYAAAIQALSALVPGGSDSAHSQYTLPGSGVQVSRPLTAKENLELRVEDYHILKDEHGRTRTQEERLRLFHTFLDSCTGISTTRRSFLIIPQARRLISLQDDDRIVGLPEDGKSLRFVPSLYNRPLPKNQVLGHQGWLDVVESDLTLLRTYRDIIFTEGKHTEAMAFWVRGNEEKELYSLSLGELEYGSNFSALSSLKTLKRFAVKVG